MTALKIYKLEDYALNEVVSTLHEGEHILGRGDVLNCNDKRVSRKHAVINITSNGASITSVHVNPCFFRPSGGSIKILPRDEATPLNDDDQFALLPSTYWFKVRLVKENVTDDHGDDVQSALMETGINGHDVPSSTNKRSCDEPEEASKKQKIDDETTRRDARSRSNSVEALFNVPETVDISNESVNDDSFGHAETIRIEDVVKRETVSDDEEDENDVLNKSKEDIEVKDEPVGQPEVNTEAGTSNNTAEAKDDSGNKSKDDTNVDDGNKDSGSTSTVNQPNTSTRRDKCWYGASCYRRNPQHRIDLSHPGDPDYNSDAADDRPDCPFGAACYRTNLAHRQQFKHAGKPAPRPTGAPPTTTKTPKKKKQQTNNADDSDEDDSSDAASSGGSGGATGGRKKRKAALKKKKYAETPEDDYDVNDPFINDGSSDEFVLSDDDDDSGSDWEDSQQVDEESQETRKMLKEAKKFVKGKKKGKK